MGNEDYKALRELKTDEVHQVLSRLAYLEDKLEKLLFEEGKRVKGELEVVMEESEGIIITDHPQEKQKINKNTKINKKYLNKIIMEYKGGIVLLDKAGSIKETNAIIESLLGYKKEDFKKVGLKSIFPLADRLEKVSKYSGALSQYLYLFQKRKDSHLSPIETTFLDRNKNSVVFQTKTTTLKDNNGQLVGAIILLKDLREKKALESEIKEKKEYLVKLLETSKRKGIIERLKEDIEEKRTYIEGILESSTDGITVSDTFGVIKRANKAISKLLAYPPHELIGKHWAELYPLENKTFATTCGDKILGGGGRYAKNNLEKISELFSKGETYFECYMRRKDEILVPVGCSNYWICDKEGQRVDGISIIRDLTEKKVAENKLNQAYNESQEAKENLENIFSTAVDGIINVDPQGMITRCNEAVERMTGYTQEELNGIHISQLSEQQDEVYRKVRRDMVEKLFKEKRIAEYEGCWKTKDGKLVPIEINMALFEDKHGEIAGGVISVRDISERKKLEEMKNEFISNVSHELRTPLTSIKGSIDNLLDGIPGELNEAQKEYLSIVNEESDRLVRLINDLLDLNKLEASSIKLFPEEIEYITVVGPVVFNLKEFAEKKGLLLEFEWPKKEIHLKADRDRVNQILVNLISNAIKFTERGGESRLSLKIPAISQLPHGLKTQAQVYSGMRLTRYLINSTR